MPKPKRQAKSNNRKRKTEKPPVVPQQSTPDLVNNLTDDCLVHIFQYFPIRQRLTMEQVCKRWRNVSKVAWNDIKALNFKHKQTRSWDDDSSKLSLIYPGDECFGTILNRCGRYLEQLKLGDTCHLSVLPLIGQHCQNLLRLIIEFDVHGGDCSEMLSQMPRLTYLEITNTPTFFRGNFLHSLPETLTELHLKVGGVFPKCVQLNRETLSMFQNLTKLTALTWNGFIMEPNIMEAIGQKPNLTFLSIIRCIFQGNVSDFKLLITPNLENLNLTHTPYVNDDLLIYISETCKNLKSLNLSRSSNLSNAGLMNLLKLSHLEELILNDVTNITDRPLSKMHNLKRLECEDCVNVKDRGIIKLMSHAANLQYLNVAGTRVTMDILYLPSRIVNERPNNLDLRMFVSSHVGKCWTHMQGFHFSSKFCFPRLSVVVRRDRLVYYSDPSSDPSSD